MAYEQVFLPCVSQAKVCHMRLRPEDLGSSSVNSVKLESVLLHWSQMTCLMVPFEAGRRVPVSEFSSHLFCTHYNKRSSMTQETIHCQ